MGSKDIEFPKSDPILEYIKFPPILPNPEPIELNLKLLGSP
jgi:hypothetical protein